MKEQILQTACRPDNVPPQYADIQLLPDLSRHTLQKRCNLETITKALRNHKIPHKWKYQATLSITHNGTTKTITTMEEGIGILRQWGVLPDQALQPNYVSQPQSLQNEWQVVSHKRANKKSAGGSS